METMPGDANADVVPDRRRMPSAIARATGSLTAPCATMSASGTFGELPFWRGCYNTHHAAFDVLGAARHVGQA